jgi:6-phosphogluconate dehydrogenase
MQLGMIGLGRMGSYMVQRLMKAGHECVVYDTHPQAMKELIEKDAGRCRRQSMRAFLPR